MSQKVIWAIVIIIVVVAGLWYFGVIPGMGGASQSAAGANSNNGQAPSTTGPATAAQAASAALRAAGTDSTKIAKAQVQVTAASNALSGIYPALKLAIEVSAAKGNDMGKAIATLNDYNSRISSIKSAPLTPSNAPSITDNLDAAVNDLATINTALATAPIKK